jgi:hypothetical protein
VAPDKLVFIRRVELDGGDCFWSSRVHAPRR